MSVRQCQPQHATACAAGALAARVRRGGRVAALWLAAALAAPGWALGAGPDASVATPEARASAITPAEIPARADADEQLLEAILRRSQMTGAVERFERALATQSAALKRLAAQTHGSDLTQLSVRRLESLVWHWHLNERAVAQTRAELARATSVASEDAAALASLRTAWQATRAEEGLATALLPRVDELLAQIDQAQQVLAKPLAKMLALGRTSSALTTQVQSGVAEVLVMVEEQDRSLLRMDRPPLWQALRETGAREPISVGFRRSLEIELAFADAYDAANARMLPALGALAAVLLPLMFWLKRRARALVTAGQASEPSMQALARPWAAWLLLVAAGAMLYDFQGPIMRQQLVMLLGWVPVLGLLQRRFLAVIGPWAYLSAVFYFLNLLASLLAGNDLLYRAFLLGISLSMLVTLGWGLVRPSAAGGDASHPLQTPTWRLLRWAACAVMLAAAGSNVLGNVSLAAMLIAATLDSSYVALAMYAGSKVVVAVAQVLLAGPTASRLATRHSASLVPAAAKLGRTVLVLAWLVFTLQSFRIYRPLSTFLIAVLTREFQLGELSLSLGSLVAFAAATWAAFWLAKTIRLVLSEDLLPALSLPRGVGNSISSLSYYTVLFLGLLAALAAAGFHVGQLTIVFGALGVGIGFGLQDIVRNFVAGMILMFERPIQRGDTVEVAGMTGRVREIGLRATIVTTFEGADVVVPNGMLLADKLVNWTLSGTRRRINLDISTGYGADPQRTIELLVGIARTVDGISFSPAPAAIMTGLVPGALEFNLRAWTTEGTDWVTVRSALAVKVRDGLAEAGIAVPMPQRDLHLRSVSRDAAAELANLPPTAPT